ncbi:efflux RND transporter permease subunit [Algisphaera agarilytica]|uniref:HME family heavy-metal exporter n=1 Tax=Algisphaera agarilytica TaxID=1385975 RepID=A0A7X0H3Y7_9BACT|nr:efflux RND transporter permease subunit [Algisphaera agarilytica]MBB6428843.1 HME family heavy-metal exporter [Algisphaera agarilytica]
MLKAVIRFSLNYSSLVLIAAVLVVAYAGYRLPHMSVDVFPELNAPTVTIMTESGGLSADEVEQYVTFPIETSVNGMTGVRRVRSASAIGLSIVWVDLDWGADLYDARQLVSERLNAARGSLPEDTEPFITPITSIAGEIMLVSLSSPSREVSSMDLRAYAEFDLRNKILAVPGVAQVVAIGGELPEYQVNVDQERLRLFDLTISDVVQAAGGSHSTASGGYLVDVDHFEIPIRQQSRVTRPQDIANTIIKYHDGVPVTIGQVAEVRLGPALRRGTASEGGQSAVILSIQKSPGTNTLALTDQLDILFDQIEPTLPGGAELNRDVVRQSHFIDRSIDNVTKVLLEAVVIVLVVLVLFLMNVRTTLITLTAIPISLAVGLLIMDGMNLGLNVMTLGGLTVAIGVLVDDAIIDVENVFRRLKQNRGRPESDRRDAVEVIFDASNEIRPAMVFATLIIVMVFVPLLALQGLEGRFFQPLALTYMVSIGASLLVALTVVPALCRFLLKGRLGGGGQHEDRDGFLVRLLKRSYEPSLRYAIRLRVWVIGGAGLATVGALLLASTYGTSFLPSFNEGTFTVFLLAPPGTSIIESDRLATEVEKQLVEIDGVRSVSRRTGRAERDEHAEPVSNSEIEVTVEDGRDRHEVREGIDRVLGAIPGITTMVGQPIEHRLSHVLSGTPAAITINVYGEELSELRRVAKKVEGELQALPGARDVNANREVMITSLPIRYRHAELAAVGLSPADAAEQVREAIYGERVDVVNEGIRQYDLVVRLAPDQRESIRQVRDLLLRGRGGATVRLRDVADIGPERSSNLITRENAQRKAVISLNVAEDSNLGDLVEQVRERVDPIVAEAGMTVSYGGQFEAQQSASRTILVAGLVVAVVMLLLLQISTGSMRAAVLVMLNMPLALIGGIVAIYLTEGGGAVSNTLALLGVGGDYIPPVISIASMVGFITLFGIAVRNGILLINHYNHLMQEEGVAPDEAVVQGSMERLVPILMTAISAALGLVPLALAAGEPGSELLAPLAIVTLGGLLTSTFLNLIVVPAGYALVFRCQAEPRRAPGPGASIH